MADSGRGCTNAACLRRGVRLECVPDSVKQDIRLVNPGRDLGVFFGNSGAGVCRIYRRSLGWPKRGKRGWDHRPLLLRGGWLVVRVGGGLSFGFLAFLPAPRRCMAPTPAEFSLFLIS